MKRMEILDAKDRNGKKAAVHGFHKAFAIGRKVPILDAAKNKNGVCIISGGAMLRLPMSRLRCSTHGVKLWALVCVY